MQKLIWFCFGFLIKISPLKTGDPFPQIYHSLKVASADKSNLRKYSQSSLAQLQQKITTLMLIHLKFLKLRPNNQNSLTYHFLLP